MGRTRLALIIVLALTVGTVLPAAEANENMIHFLTGPQAGDARTIALAYLETHAGDYGLSGSDLSDLVMSDRYVSRHNGVTHLYLQQRHAGIRVFNALINVNVLADGRIANLGNRFVPNLASSVNTTAPVLTELRAVQSAAQHLGLTLSEDLVVLSSIGGTERESLLSNGGISEDDIPVKLIYEAVSPGDTRLAWDLVVKMRDTPDWWNVRIDAVSGEVLSKNNWTSYDAYRVFALPAESPDSGIPHALVSDPADPLASPFAWHDVDGIAGADFTDTRGNNVFAQDDINNDNESTIGLRPDGGPMRIFDFAWDTALAPDEGTNLEAGIVNLFYWNNVIHDVLYRYGFDEASGNFQETNYSGMGLGSDHVFADGQDGAGTNGANFGTPVDGMNPRMQMFIWTPPAPNLLDIGPPVNASFPVSMAAFGPAVTLTGVTADLVLVQDSSGPVNDGCETPFINAAEINGNIALIDRGTCGFTVKVVNAQAAGAVAVIIANNVVGNPITLGGTDATITIPSGMISLASGNAVKAALPLADPVTFRNAGDDLPQNRDADFDHSVIVHEYAHGLSNRLTGGPGNVGCLGTALFPEQAGEGWSDWYALAFTTTADDLPLPLESRGIGNYITFQEDDGPGIRRFPYTPAIGVNPDTYGLLVGAPGNGVSVPHGIGSVWAAMLWDVYWHLVNLHGFDPDLYAGSGGNNLALELVTDGLKLQPCGPTSVDARNAILLADLINNGGANQCDIWAAFARRGLGLSANANVVNNLTDNEEAFDLPLSCQGLFADSFESGNTFSWSSCESCAP